MLKASLRHQNAATLQDTLDYVHTYLESTLGNEYDIRDADKWAHSRWTIFLSAAGVG